MKEKAPKLLVLLCIFLCGLHTRAQCDLTIPIGEQFLCLYDAPMYDFGSYGSPPGGTYSGVGMEPNGEFIPSNATIGAGSTSITEVITITYTVDIGGSPCTATADINLSVPEASSIDPIPSLYCTDDPITPLVGSPGMGTPNAAFTIDGAPPFGNDEFIPAFYGSGDHVIVFNYLDFSIGCFSRDSAFVSVYTPEELNDLTVISQDEIPTVLCADSDPVVLTPFPDDGILSGNGISGNTFDPAVAGVGEHTIYFEYTTPLGACSTIDSTTIVIDELVADFMIQASACAGETDTLIYTGSTQDGSLNISWDVHDATIELNEGDTLLVVMSDNIGTYDVDLTVEGSIDCLQASSSDQVDKSGLVTVETIEDQVLGLDDDEITLFTTADSNDGSNITFEWTPPGDLSCSDCPDPILTPNGDQTYTVVATDANGCSASDEVLISVSFTKDVFVPNAFTPNGDGNNDMFYVYGQGIQEVELKIHDRWGALVFETNDPNTGWDGNNYDGEQLNSAVFYYSLYTTFIDGDQRVQSGDITLIR